MKAGRLVSLIGAALLSGVAAGCSGAGPSMPDLPPAPTGVPHIAAASLTHPRWDAVLAAGDLPQHAHDDAAAELARRLGVAGVPLERVRVLSADPARIETSGSSHRNGRGGRGDEDDRGDGSAGPDGGPGFGAPGFDGLDGRGRRRDLGLTEPARPANLLRALLHLEGRRGGACLAYLGSTSDGESLAMLDGSISPDQLDRALAGGCADAPTVVIVSGCRSGAFAAAPVARPNRLVIAAAPAGESGFGCGPNLGYTTFDECLLGALPGAPTWIAAFERTRRCVLRREALVGQPEVAPVIAAGGEVAALPAPWRAETGRDGIVEAVQFRQGIGRVTRDAVPYYSTLKARTATAIDAYIRAPAPKALALTLAGTVAWASAADGETPDDVARLALERCEYRSGGACMLYARDMSVTAVNTAGQPPIHPPTLARRGRVAPATTPFIRSDQRGEIAAYLRLSGPKALALGPDDEAIGIGTGPTPAAARAAALGRCRAARGRCVIFADNDEIVLGGS